MFQALLLSKSDAAIKVSIEELDEGALPEGDVRLSVEYSSLNFKDALAITNRAPVVRRWPMVPGIDGAGVVESSSHAGFRPGDRVVLNGWGAGETRWGCMAGKASVSGEWLVALPERLSTWQSMAIGTAGYTAMLCVMAIEKHGVGPGDGPVLVTGASGGVGSIAVSLLAGLGYEVAASTGRPEKSAYLQGLGATEIIDRASLAEPGKPLQKERWAAAIDAVGGTTLANVCAQIRYRGIVAACGLAQSMDFPATVAPFILRGVVLAGVDSVMAPAALRRTAWERLAGQLDPAVIGRISSTIPLDRVPSEAGELLDGRVHGRRVIALAGAG